MQTKTRSSKREAIATNKMDHDPSWWSRRTRLERTLLVLGVFSNLVAFVLYVGLYLRETGSLRAETERLGKADMRTSIFKTKMMDYIMSLNSRMGFTEQQLKSIGNITYRLDGVVRKKKQATYEDPRDPSKSQTTFYFKIANFCRLDDVFVSPPTYVRNLPWRIRVKPRWWGKENEERKYLGFFLQCDGPPESLNWSVEATYQLRLVPQYEGIASVQKMKKDVFPGNPNLKNWGWGNFFPWDDICDPSRGYIKDGTVILEASVKADAPIIG